MTTPESRGVVVYDGDCQFCRKQIARIQARDRNERFEYLPRQAPGIEQRFPRLADADFNTGMRLIAPGGQVHVGADAVYEIARALPRWRLVAWVYRLPMIHFLARAVYAWIAAHRRSLGRDCHDGLCQTQPSEMNAKRTG